MGVFHLVGECRIQFYAVDTEGDHPSFEQEPLGVVRAEAGANLLKCAQDSGVEIEAACGGSGRCGQCRVFIPEQANVSPLTDSEKRVLSPREIEAGVRLACRVKVYGSTKVGVPASQSRRRHRILLDGMEKQLTVDPAVRRLAVKVDEPELGNVRSDLTRTVTAIRKLEPVGEVFPLKLMRNLAHTLRENDHGISVVLSEEQTGSEARNVRVISIEGPSARALYGMVFDIGTTTVVGGLVDLSTGREIAVVPAINSQGQYGADVISRINFAGENERGLQLLRERILETLNGIVERLLNTSGTSASNVYMVTVVGNTCMQHLFLGIDPTHLAHSPYTPVFQQRQVITAAEARLAINPQARVHILPNIAGFVGADTVGVMLACGLDNATEPTLAIDIGTNGEMVLAVEGRMLACSTAAGPAFEGAQIKHGMRAADGAIEGIRLSPNGIDLTVIGDTAPVGICGSGLIDATAELLKMGIMDSMGRLMSPDELPPEAFKLKPNVVAGDKGSDFLLARDQGNGREDIVLTQGDLRQLQLAKGAIHAGWSILLKEAGISVSDLKVVVLAGAFGNYIKKKSALRLGLLPDVPEEMVRSVGNAARIGAKIALVNKQEMLRADRIAREVEYVPLSGRPDFQMEFMEAMVFPEAAVDLSKSETA